MPYVSDPRIFQTGLATLNTTAGAIDAYASVALQTVRAEHGWDEEVVKDFAGFDAAWLVRNTHVIITCSIKITGASKAGAVANAFFLFPLAKVKLSGFACDWLNEAGVPGPPGSTSNIYMGDWSYYKGGTIDLSNERVGGLELPLRKYADPTQNTASTTPPV